MRRMAAILALLGSLLGLTGCGGVKYHVDYDGRKEWYENARDSYRAGETVTLYYGLIATDTDYSFYLDDESINVSYDEKKGFIIEFVMPDHDVKLRCEARNTMEYVP